MDASEICLIYLYVLKLGMYREVEKIQIVQRPNRMEGGGRNISFNNILQIIKNVCIKLSYISILIRTLPLVWFHYLIKKYYEHDCLFIDYFYEYVKCVNRLFCYKRNTEW